MERILRVVFLIFTILLFNPGSVFADNNGAESGDRRNHQGGKQRKQPRHQREISGGDANHPSFGCRMQSDSQKKKVEKAVQSVRSIQYS